MFTIFAMLVAVLVKIIMFLGIAALIALIAWIAKIVLEHLLKKLKELLRKRVGGKVVVTSVKPILNEIVKQKEREGNVQALSELEEQLRGEGVITATTDEEGNVLSDDIKITKTNDMDERIVNLLDKNDGALVVKNG